MSTSDASIARSVLNGFALSLVHSYEPARALSFVPRLWQLEPLDREIESIEFLLASCLWRNQQEEVPQ